MNVDDFRAMALSFPGAEEGSHMGHPDFRVGGHIFATLASQSSGSGNLMLSPELQALFISQAHDVFMPVSGGWGRSGATLIVLSKASETQLVAALRAAFNLRLERNLASRSKPKSAKKPS